MLLKFNEQQMTVHSISNPRVTIAETHADKTGIEHIRILIYYE